MHGWTLHQAAAAFDVEADTFEFWHKKSLVLTSGRAVTGGVRAPHLLLPEDLPGAQVAVSLRELEIPVARAAAALGTLSPADVPDDFEGYVVVWSDRASAVPEDRLVAAVSLWPRPAAVVPVSAARLAHRMRTFEPQMAKLAVREGQTT